MKKVNKVKDTYFWVNVAMDGRGSGKQMKIFQWISWKIPASIYYLLCPNLGDIYACTVY